MSRILTAAMVALLATGAAGRAFAATPITDEAKTALLTALDDEYKAEAFYAAVLAKFGDVRPFVNIIKAEQTHASEIRTVMKTYGVDAVDNPFLGDSAVVASVPATVQDACAVGVQAEIDNRDLYDNKLMPVVADYPDIKVVFKALRDASNDKHLPAFQRCLTRGGGGAGRNNPS